MLVTKPNNPATFPIPPFQSCPPKGQMVSSCISTASRKIFYRFFFFFFFFFSLLLSLEKLVFLLFRQITCPRTQVKTKLIHTLGQNKIKQKPLVPPPLRNIEGVKLRGSEAKSRYSVKSLINMGEGGFLFSVCYVQNRAFEYSWQNNRIKFDKKSSQAV